MGIIPCDDPKSPDCPCIACEARRLDAALTAAQARIEELERMVVFLSNDKDATLIKGELFIGPDGYPCDGTTASILAAVEKAMVK